MPPPNNPLAYTELETSEIPIKAQLRKTIYNKPAINGLLPVMNQSRTLMNTPSPVMNQPRTLMNTPSPVMNQPRTLMNTPSPVMNQPRTLMNTPSPVMNQPRTLLNGPTPLMMYGRLTTPVNGQSPTSSVGAPVTPSPT